MNKKILINAAIAIGVIIVVFLHFNAITEIDYIRIAVTTYGYVGIFFASILSGFNLLVPIPVVIFTPLFTELGLNIIIVVFAISAGLTLGDLVMFYVGRGGHSLFDSDKRPFMKKMERLRDERPKTLLVVLFLFASLVPLPNELLLTPFGFMGMRLRQVLPVAFLGNLVFNTLVASGIAGIFNILI